MSDKATDSTILTAEQNEEVVQESSQLSNEESGVQVLADENQPEVNADVKTKSSGSSDADETSDEVNPDESSQHQSNLQDTVDINDANKQYSQKSVFSGGGKVMESQQGEVNEGSRKFQQGDSFSGTEVHVSNERDGTESQEGGGSLDTESQKGGADSQTGGATGGADSQTGGATGGADSQTGGAIGGVSFRNSKFPLAVLGASQQDSNNSSTEDSQEVAVVCGTSLRDSIISGTGGAIPKRRAVKASVESSKTGDSQETAIVSGTSRRVSIVSGAEGGISNRPDLQESIDSSKTGDSQETAVVGDLSSQNSFESGVDGDVSNSPQESLPHSSESWEGMAAPALPSQTAWLPWWSERRGQDYSPRSYEQCFRYCSNACDYLRPFSRRILKSGTFDAVRIFLFIIAILVISMGLGHIYDCAASIELPVLVSFLGGVGAALLATSWAMENRRLLCPNYHLLLLRAGMVLASLLFLGLFGAVLHFTYTISPSFDDERKENYCHKGFYYFTYVANFLIGAMVVAAFFIYVPTLNDDEIHYDRI